jgi:hypothetical protein
MPVLDDGPLASEALWRCLLNGAADDPVGEPIGGLPLLG